MSNSDESAYDFAIELATVFAAAWLGGYIVRKLYLKGLAIHAEELRKAKALK